MKKRKNKIIQAICFIFLIMIILVNSNFETKAYTADELKSWTHDEMMYSSEIWCINHGVSFSNGKYYCIEEGEKLDPRAVYIIYKFDELRERFNSGEFSHYDYETSTELLMMCKYCNTQVTVDATQTEILCPNCGKTVEVELTASTAFDEDAFGREAMWLLGLGTNYNAEFIFAPGGVPGPEMADFLTEAEIAANVKSSGNISIHEPADGDFIYENDSRLFGPFNITYPSYVSETTGEVTAVADEFKILINGKELTTINGGQEGLPKSGEDFYLSEEDGIILGEENTIKVIYKGQVLSGTYKKYTPEKTITRTLTCSECGKEYEQTKNGVKVNDEILENESEDWEVLTENEDGDLEVVPSPEEGDICTEMVTNHTHDGNCYGYTCGKYSHTHDDEECGLNCTTTHTHTDSCYTCGKYLHTHTYACIGLICDIPEEKQCGGIYVAGDISIATKKYQDLINPDPQWTPVSEEEELVFWTGRKIVINLDKIDNAEIANALAGIEFDIELSGITQYPGKSYISVGENQYLNTTITTDENGEAQIVIITYEDNIRLTIEEKDNGLYTDSGPIVIDFEFDENRKEWTTNIVKPTETSEERDLISLRQQREWFEFDLEIVNIAIIEELKLIKLNTSIEGQRILGVEFRIILENAETVDGGKKVIVAKTDVNGEITLGKLKVLDPNKDIVITIEEIGVPDSSLNFGGLYPGGEIVITIQHGKPGCNVQVIGADKDVVNAIHDVEENTIIAEIKNEITMDLSGTVWLDEQTGIKPVSGPNGLYDSSENTMENIKVVARRVSDGAIIQTVRTDANGNYRLEDLPASSGTDNRYTYYVEFTYDGINYIATQTGGDSDATEKDRTAFNNTFKTIEKDMAYGTDGTETPLQYNYSATEAILETMSNGTVKGEFAITADTLSTTYSTTTSDIDLGLVKKDVDLAAFTDVDKAVVRINGEDEVYDQYNMTIDENGNLKIDGLKNQDVNYNLYLYNSDYNYRIGNYHLEAVHSMSDSSSASGLLTQRRKDGELNVEVTYQVLLSNQSATDARINQIAYYYDSRYILNEKQVEIDNVIIDSSNIEIIPNAATTGSGSSLVTYNKAIINVNVNLTDADSQSIAKLPFDVAKDSSGNIYTGIMENIVEIISYSTNSGCVDCNSAPDNIEINGNENDTDDAPGLNIQLNNIERQVSGYVFEDSKPDVSGEYNMGDGIYDKNDSNETTINDVIVQLIEIKDVDIDGDNVKDVRLEYIWQETVSGYDVVKVVSNDGTKKINIKYTTDRNLNGTTFTENGITYTYKYIQKEVEDGGYKFIDFIPGDYIVRFIYGDGTYYEKAINGEETDDSTKKNILKYNGQDYKSTRDIGYNKDYYWEDTYYTYSLNSSMARDNEARRLEEMAYATSVTSASDLIINSGTDTEKQNKLNATWMCAETSPILMGVSDSAAEGDTTAMKENINFGLSKRPQVALSLEKHITGLSIGTDFIATADFDKYNESINNVVKTEGSFVLATATNKSQNTMGTWLVDLEANSIAGKNIKITYSYLIKNVGEIDYIGVALKNAESYSAAASTVKNEISNPISTYIIGTYLGESYYNNENNEKAANNEVASEISVQVEDYYSKANGLELDNSSDWEESDTTEPKPIWRYDSTGAAIEDSEDVYVLKSKRIIHLASDETETLKLTLKGSTDSTGSNSKLQYRSYAAQLTYPSSGNFVSTSGTICSEKNTLGNLGIDHHGAVKSYVETDVVKIEEIVPEIDESIAEMVQITVNTGGDKATPIILITTITAGLAVVAVGIVLVKKFVIK